jgi:hypothetical protein
MHPFFAQDVVNAKTISILAQCFNHHSYNKPAMSMEYISYLWAFSARSVIRNKADKIILSSI